MYRKNDLILPTNNKQTEKQRSSDSHISGLICSQVQRVSGSSQVWRPWWSSLFKVAYTECRLIGSEGA